MFSITYSQTVIVSTNVLLSEVHLSIALLKALNKCTIFIVIKIYNVYYIGKIYSIHNILNHVAPNRYYMKVPVRRTTTRIGENNGEDDFVK